MKQNHPPLIEFRNLTVIKGLTKKVLDSINLTINIGENVAIIGPNGSGKSSLIKTITREYYPVSTVPDMVCRIWGQEVWNIFDLRYLLGIVSDDLMKDCFRKISVRNTILSGFFSSIGLYRHNITKDMQDKVDYLLDFLDIEHLSNRNMTELSSGESKKVLIARALVHDPKALVLDEPTNSLDLRALHHFQQTLRKIAGSGINVVMVTHHLQDIIPEINRVILLKEGRIFRDGIKEDILTDNNISMLFEVNTQVVKRDGYYYAWV
ncbi:ATP-binding cassette domain-containing protein [Candidatus Poribacteria bacterium]|nr:ATP-binding cassette domain-containing protein [Candidatus Poribacteria bacterium]